jgi:serine/threonine-protein kinase
LLVGDVIAGKYRIDGIAGEGGMGIVYEAEHVILRQRVAVKAMLPGRVSTTEALDRFSLEASAIARIACDHVVRVMDAGTLPNGSPYLVMEFLEGDDLERILLRRGPIPPADVVDYALQALEALAHAHAARVIHRDLKCANLFLACTPDRREIIKLLDFGLAMFEGGEGQIVGSPRYMSPEQLRKDALDPRTDLWSLGVVMYELLCGQPPFDGELSELVASIVREPHVPVHERRRAIAPALSGVVERCLRKDPAQRWATTVELARALAPHGSGAWRAAVERIERVHTKAAAPLREPRRFESEDAALQALDSSAGRELRAPNPISSAVTLGATMPAPPPPADASAVDLVPAARPALRILMIDDSEFVLSVHGEVLAEAGFDVRSTTSPEEFDDLLTSWKPHLVLMDVQMPAVSGEELCRRVKAKFKAHVPVAFVSHLEAPQLEARARGAGAEAYLTKTGDWPKLVAFVRNICALTFSPEHLP